MLTDRNQGTNIKLFPELCCSKGWYLCLFVTSRLKLFGDYVYLPNTNSFAGSKTVGGGLSGGGVPTPGASYSASNTHSMSNTQKLWGYSTHRAVCLEILRFPYYLTSEAPSGNWLMGMRAVVRNCRYFGRSDGSNCKILDPRPYLTMWLSPYSLSSQRTCPRHAANVQ